MMPLDRLIKIDVYPCPNLNGLKLSNMVGTPYLSVVATARNDNHGGNMLRRMQIFVNGLIEQSRRYQLPTELIIVEWNPPSDRPKLTESLTWAVEDSPCVVRIIEVPPELHQQVRYAQALPLFQMLAKNVGIRRAQGEYILATNIDLVFSDALFEFLASRQMQPGKSYRIDRYDVRSTVPLEAPIVEQLGFCDQNILRINHKEGIEEFDVEFPQPPAVTPEPITEPEPSKWYENLSESTVSRLATLRKVYKRLLPTAVRDSLLNAVPKDFQEWLIAKGLLSVKPTPPPPEPEVEEVVLPPWQYPRLHTNACGDFTLMSKQDWFAIRAYPEWEIFSFHLDSVLLYVAHYAGIEEVVLGDPIRVYHIEHASGWTPQAERDQSLNKRLAKLKIPQLSNEQFDAIARLMEQTGKPLLVNQDDWGMAATELPERAFAAVSAIP
jgi:hypothetical protein